ncbi:MAG: pinensin family lanthipeptide [Cyclobacteriaceae bacterium]
MKKDFLKLDQLKVSSFVTETRSELSKGGYSGQHTCDANICDDTVSVQPYTHGTCYTRDPNFCTQMPCLYTQQGGTCTEDTRPGLTQP